MKKLKKLGKILSKVEQKEILGGRGSSVVIGSICIERGCSTNADCGTGSCSNCKEDWSGSKFCL